MDKIVPFFFFSQKTRGRLLDTGGLLGQNLEPGDSFGDLVLSLDDLESDVNKEVQQVGEGEI